MKRFLKILYVILWVLVFSGAIVLIVLAERNQYGRQCRQVSINIEYGTADILITRMDIDSIILKTAGMIKGKPLGYINTGSIERAIRKQPYVAKVAVFENNEGTVFINVRQREPILRIINNKYENFYLDEAGSLLPVNPKFSAHVLVANGNINASYRENPNYQVNILRLSDSIFSDSLLTNLYRVAMYISHNKFLKAQIDQVYISESNEFELIPKVGNHLILLGTPEDLENKFRKLFAFYKYGLNNIGWNKYNIINIKYKNQVVCSKI